MTTSTKAHWENVYSTKAVDAVSWYQPHATTSLALLSAHGARAEHALIDVGGGASTLVDDLLARGFRSLTVLDLSAAALDKTRERLGARASTVTFLVDDVTAAALPARAYDVWHDRAVFHFLTEETARRAYIETLSRALKPGGLVVIATFADDGPEKCSGLPVARYAPEQLAQTLGASFTLLESRREEHVTPFGTTQRFIACAFRFAS